MEKGLPLVRRERGFSLIRVREKLGLCGFSRAPPILISYTPTSFFGLANLSTPRTPTFSLCTPPSLCFGSIWVYTTHLFVYCTHCTSFYFLHPCLTLHTPPVYFVHLPHVIVLHPISLSIVFGHVVMFTLCTPTNHSCTPIFCFSLLSFLNNFILLFI